MLILISLFLNVLAYDLPRFYHSTQDIQIEIQEIATKCKLMQYETVGGYPKIGMLSFNKGQPKPNKAFIVFGEHAREMISPETGLHFVKNLCQQNEQSKYIEDNYELKMILNLNPMSRSKVEKGDFCLRENENGVDLNRNYKAHFSTEHNPEMTHTAPGPFAFSESETQTVREQVKNFKPDAFLSIHSGTLGLFAPYAYAKELAKDNIDNMMDVLSDIRESRCKQCKMGSCGKEIGYLSNGTSMDWAYDEMKIPYSFTFEIFHSAIDLREKPQSFLEIQESDKTDMINEQIKLDELLREHAIMAQTETHEMSDEGCLKFFNPVDEDQYKYYIENWSNAIVDALQKIGNIRTQ